MKKLKSTILSLYGWKRVNNTNYPEDELFHKSWGYATIEMAWTNPLNNAWFHIFFKDSGSMSVIYISTILNLLLSFRFDEILGAPIGFTIASISLINIGATIIVLSALIKWVRFWFAIYRIRFKNRKEKDNA